MPAHSLKLILWVEYCAVLSTTLSSKYMWPSQNWGHSALNLSLTLKQHPAWMLDHPAKNPGAARTNARPLSAETRINQLWTASSFEKNSCKALAKDVILSFPLETELLWHGDVAPVICFSMDILTKIKKISKQNKIVEIIRSHDNLISIFVFCNRKLWGNSFWLYDCLNKSSLHRKSWEN